MVIMSISEQVKGWKLKFDILSYGGLAEWSIAVVLKTIDRLFGPGVRIPHPPLL